MKLRSPYTPNQINKILHKQVDKPPSIMRCLITLNAHYFTGISPVCGKVNGSGFDLRNRKGPSFSLRVKGKFLKLKEGTEIELSFSKPIFPDILGLLFNRYKEDKRLILNFLKEWIKTNGGSEQHL